MQYVKTCFAALMLVATNGTMTPFAVAQVTAQHTNTQSQKSSDSDLEMFYSTQTQPNGSVKVELTVAGLRGVEVSQLSHSSPDKTLSRIDIAPAGVVVGNSPNLYKASIVLEKEEGQATITLFISEHGNSKKGVKLRLPANTKEESGSVKVAYSLVYHQTPLDDGSGSGGGGCPVGTYPVSYTSIRCGTITACCPTPSPSIDGVNCTITCN